MSAAVAPDSHQGLSSSLLASLRSPSFWVYSSWLDLVAQYRGSMFGLVWLCLPTVVFVLLMGNVYSHLMGYSVAEYMPYLATGYVVWRFMLQVVNDAAGTFLHHRAYIQDGRIRLTDFLLRSFAKAGFRFLFAMIVVAAVLAWSQHWNAILSLASMVVTLPLVLVNLFWMSVCVGLVGARFPDMRDAIGTVMVAGFLLTPILWKIDRFPPDSYRGLLSRLNPAYHLVDLVRAPVLGHMPELSSVLVAVVMAVLGWALASVLYRRYARYVALWF